MKLKAGAEALFQNYFEMLKLESGQLQPQREVTRRSKACGSTAGSPRSSSPSNKAFRDAGDAHVESKIPGSTGTLGCRRTHGTRSFSYQSGSVPRLSAVHCRLHQCPVPIVQLSCCTCTCTCTTQQSQFSPPFKGCKRIIVCLISLLL